MTLDEYNAFCGALPGANYVVQWRGAHVWKVLEKLFAIGRFDEDGARITFKASELSYEVLREQPGLRPAPHMASRGLKWVQHYAEPGLSDDELRAYLTESHRMAALGLSKKKRRDLGLD